MTSFITSRRQALILAAGGAAASLASIASPARADSAAALKALGLELPAVATPIGSYAPFTRHGDLVFVSGQLPLKDGKLLTKGRVGVEVSLEEAQAAARQCALNVLGAAAAACGGDLERITACLKLTGFVACDPAFTDHPKVVNGASDLIKAVLGDRGRHARAAVGVASLPMGAPVEVEAVFGVRA
jgi:enamine deaminase RidA (YjgF/YER057c/UK114 family)